MGIRIRKTMGWAFLTKKDIDYENFEDLKLKDINTDGIHKMEFDLETVVSPDDPLTDFIHFAEEEEKNTLCTITPPLVVKKWTQYDSPIDYQESLLNHSIDASRKIKVIRRELYPYSQPFVVSKNLKEVPKKIVFLIHSRVPSALAEINKELLDLGFDLNSPLEKQIHMTAPLIVQRILEKIKPNLDYRKLKPVIVTSWE